MTKDSVLSLLRIVFTAFGAYLVGKNLWGTPIDAPLWETLVGAAMALASTVWGIVDKSATIEAVQSGVRSVIVVLGGLLVASGKLKEETLTAVLGVIAIIIPWLQSNTSRAKIKQIETGKVSTNQLKS